LGQPLTYAKLFSVLDSGPRVWRIDSDCVAQIDPDGVVTPIMFKDIHSVRLGHGSRQGFRSAVLVIASNMNRFAIDDLHASGVREQTPQADWSPFVRILLSRIAQDLPSMKVRIGSSPPVAILNATNAVAVMALGLFWALETDRGWGTILLAVIMTAVGALGLWRTVRYWPKLVRVAAAADEWGLP
jgi:hypothetical protein